MTTKNEHMEEMASRATYTIALDRKPGEEGGEGDDIAVAVMITDQRGKALAIEVGTGDHGAFASARAFDGDDETEPMVFVDTTSTMIVVE